MRTPTRFYRKLKNVSCEYDSIAGYMSPVGPTPTSNTAIAMSGATPHVWPAQQVLWARTTSPLIKMIISTLWNPCTYRTLVYHPTTVGYCCTVRRKNVQQSKYHLFQHVPYGTVSPVALRKHPLLHQSITFV